MRNEKALMAQEQGLFQCFSLLLLGWWDPRELETKQRKEGVRVGEEKM